MSKERCRNQLQTAGKPYPKSGCEVCGGVFNVCKFPVSGVATQYNPEMSNGMNDKPNIEKRREAIDTARNYAMGDKDRTKDEQHLLLGELVSFIHVLYPDHAKEQK